MGRLQSLGPHGRMAPMSISQCEISALCRTINALYLIISPHYILLKYIAISWIEAGFLGMQNFIIVFIIFSLILQAC